jgi:hypothetical protein
MVVVPAGSFTMGSPPSEEGRSDSEGPQHRVTIARPFAVGKFEVTFAEWDACVAAGGCSHRPGDQGWGRGNRPVIDVSWNDITQQYLPWLSRKTGKTYRLLSEAEWEYAARAGTTTAFSTGRTITPEQANFDGNYTYGGSAKGVYRSKTVEVGSFPPNAFGLFDMHGNLWEWCRTAERGPQRRALGRLGQNNRRLRSPGPARRLLVLPSEVPPLRGPRREHHRLPGLRRRVPCREDAYPLTLYLFTSMVRGAKPPGRVGIYLRRTMSDNSKRTGAAIEAHYQFLLWLAPTLEKFPRSQKFTLGDRIQNQALDILEALIEATYTRDRLQHLRRANLGIEKLRFLFRLAADLRVLDRRRYEFVARTLDETGRSVGAWAKAHNAATA